MERLKIVIFSISLSSSEILLIRITSFPSRSQTALVGWATLANGSSPIARRVFAAGGIANSPIKKINPAKAKAAGARALMVLNWLAPNAAAAASSPDLERPNNATRAASRPAIGANFMEMMGSRAET